MLAVTLELRSDLDGQRAAFRHVVDGATATQKVLLKAIAAKHFREKPLRDRVELLTIHIHGVERAGLAYVGYQLDCGWDAEHTLGVLTHGKRVVEVGSADTAFLSWIAERDRKTLSLRHAVAQSPPRAAQPSVLVLVLE